MNSTPQPRKHLSADGLLKHIRQCFQKVTDQRTGNIKIHLADALMCAMAMFSLKEPSLLALDQRRKQDEGNLQQIFQVEQIPSDTCMRETLDPVAPEQLRPAFRSVFAHLSSGKGLEKFHFHENHCLLAIDGTEYFSSKKIQCSSCLEKHHNNGDITYHHQMLGASIVFPGRKEVIPLMPEPIIKQDGETKNDCERNALKRFLTHFRQDHPNLKTIALLDALYASAPVIGDLRAACVRWIIRVKPKGNPFLYGQVDAMAKQGLTEEFKALGVEGIHRRYRIAKNVPLNDSNQDLRVDVLDVVEATGSGKWQRFTYILDPSLGLCRKQAELWMRAGRARWKIENETFNTIKNQGYHFEHNFGHGHANLSVVLATLMMLAFLVDQVQQLCCPVFAAVWDQCISKRALWERMREVFHWFEVKSMQELYEAILSDRKLPASALFDTS